LLRREPVCLSHRVIPEAGLPEIFDFGGKPSYPESRATRSEHRALDSGSQGSQGEPFRFALA
jgi:hypothetical protein